MTLAIADANRAGVGTIESAEQMEERRLADAGRADDGQHLAALDRQVEVVEAPAPAPRRCDRSSTATRASRKAMSARLCLGARVEVAWYETLAAVWIATTPGNRPALYSAPSAAASVAAVGAVGVAA